ncbi:hypothetical protein [Pseudovibrio sp. Tun.PSC04-5.I4]|uniref:hypothetical protein n=1 Tax=Pseudovibrio sp. Tun.PSC04-5.I4 TaxID=1798213 RepID=UPI0008925F61|nr:hypothetical protein [Pseudovibrio sp. Tun.PSC04-5.I4]SDQ99315.1 hypothetical protein SAMN04515695_2216 [Pseudovibrio sp. Tun.PSC04-5.I4]
MTTVTTRYGRTWDLLDPQANLVSFWEIAEVLAHIPRFNGHTKMRYSVAQHCCMAHDHVCEENDPQLRLLALLHDAHEAYIGDIITPVKEALCALPGGGQVDVALEHLKVRHDMAIHDAAGLPSLCYTSQQALVKSVDKDLLLEEQRWLFPQDNFRKPKIFLAYWTEKQSAKEFMQRLYASPIYRAKLWEEGELTQPQFLTEIERLAITQGQSSDQAKDYAERCLADFLHECGCEYGSHDHAWDLNAAETAFTTGLWESER